MLACIVDITMNTGTFRTLEVVPRVGDNFEDFNTVVDSVLWYPTTQLTCSVPAEGVEVMVFVRKRKY